MQALITQQLQMSLSLYLTNFKNNFKSNKSCFLGIGCDGNADRLMAMLDDNIKATKGDSKWQQ